MRGERERGEGEREEEEREKSGERPYPRVSVAGEEARPARRRRGAAAPKLR